MAPPALEQLVLRTKGGQLAPDALISHEDVEPHLSAVSAAAPIDGPRAVRIARLLGAVVSPERNAAIHQAAHAELASLRSAAALSNKPMTPAAASLISILMDE